MIVAPRRGMRVQVWYAKPRRDFMPHHGAVGVVLVSGRGKPRNHLIMVNGLRVVVPCGNIRLPI